MAESTGPDRRPLVVTLGEAAPRPLVVTLGEAAPRPLVVTFEAAPSVGGTVVQFAIGSNALGGSLDELERAAMEYNLGRTGGHRHVQLEAPFHGMDEPVLLIPDPDRPMSPNAMRTASVLMGAWVYRTGPGCQPGDGVHNPGCPHQANTTAYTRRSLARATFGNDGGSQLGQVARALDELADNTTEIFLANPETGGYARQVSHILSLREVGTLPNYARPGDLPPDATGYISWDPFLHRSLMAGHYQAFPLELVQELSGADFAVWLHVLLRRPSAELMRYGKPGETRAYAVTGRDPSISPARLGLGRQRRDKLEGSLTRAAERGNALVRDLLGVELTVQSRAHGAGMNLVLTSVWDQAEARQSRTEGAAIQDGRRGNLGRKARQPRTRNEHETARVDGSLDGSLDGSPDAGESITGESVRENRLPTGRENVEAAMADALAEGRPDLAALYEKTGWTRATPVVRRTLADMASRHTAGYAWVVERIREAPEGGRPSAVIRYVLDRDAEDRARWAAEAEAAEAAERRDRALPAGPYGDTSQWPTLRATFGTPPVVAPPAEPSPDRERRVAEWRRVIVGRDPPAAAARRAIADYAPDLDDLAELL